MNLGLEIREPPGSGLFHLDINISGFKQVVILLDTNIHRNTNTLKHFYTPWNIFLAVELVWYSWLGNKKAVWSGPLPSRLSLLPPIGPRQSLFPFTKYVHSFLTSPYVEYSPTDKNMTRAISLSCHKIFQLPSQYVFAHVYIALDLLKKTILCSRHIFAVK